MLRLFIFITSFIGFCVLVFFLFASTPTTAGPFGVLVVFISAYLLLIGLITSLISFVSNMLARLSILFVFRKPIEPLPLKRSYYYSTIIAAAPIMLLGLQSVGTVGVYEYLLILLFVGIGCLYVAKRAS